MNFLYLFDLEGSFACVDETSELLVDVTNEIAQNKQQYIILNGNDIGYVPKQETVFFNANGEINLFKTKNNVKEPFDFGEYCCKTRMPYLLTKLKEKNLFNNIDTTTFYWDLENQKCRWKPIEDVCSFDAYKIVLNPVNNDGALFNIEQTEKDCTLTIDFKYLFKFDCENLSKLLTQPNIDPKISNDIKDLENRVANKKIECENISNQISAKTTSYLNTYYSIVNPNNINEKYCINEINGGLSQLKSLLGPLKYDTFIKGEPNSYTISDFNAFKILNSQSITQSNKELSFTCNLNYGYKSDLKNDIDELVILKNQCSIDLKKLEDDLLNLKNTSVNISKCSKPIEVLETFNATVTLDVIQSDGSLKTISEFDLHKTIGSGNLYNYLLEKQDESGFYLCSLPKSTETWTTGCTSLIANELVWPATVPSKEKNLNVLSCETTKNSLINSLISESGLNVAQNTFTTFNKNLSKNIFSSNWVNFSTIIDDDNIIDLIKNKQIKFSIKINKSCTDVCVYVDEIKLTKECVNGVGKKITINKSPGFELEKTIDNKKSWANNITKVNREFDIENISNLTVFRQTDYDVNDERLVINTKEIDLDINIASAIETDVQSFIIDNPTLLESTPSNDCGCSDSLPCYEDVFNIIPYSEAVDSGMIPSQIEPEDLLSLARAVRNAWLVSWSQLMLATGPYLDIINGIYHPNPSEDVMTTYRATRDAYLLAIHEFNSASGGGYIEGLTVDKEFNYTESDNYIRETYSNYEKLAPQMFNTKCGRIFKRSNHDGYIYFVETQSKELKVFWAFEDFAPRNTTWIDITSLVQEDYAANWNYGGASSNTPEKASYFCKFMMPNNYTSWGQMMSFHYQTNGNTSHNEWINSVEDSFFIEWDSAKGKCMTNKFKEVVPEQFSMHFPITSLNFWKNYISPATIESPECSLDVYLRNSATTACTTVDFTWPTIASDIDNVYRDYSLENLKLRNQTKLTERTSQYYVYTIDPATNMAPDESGGAIPVKVTTTIRKGSRDGDIVFKEEYVFNDPSSTCIYYNGGVGLKKLSVLVGITDPNSAYWNSNSGQWDYINYCSGSEFGTLLSGNTSMLPLAGASDNAIDRNWSFDENYYVHFDVVNNNTGYVYEVTNNDFNLKDRTMPIVCPSSASTQTFNINTALNSINTHKLKMLSNIQEDLDHALDICSCSPLFYTDFRQFDFMDDLRVMPSYNDLLTLPYSAETVDYSSSNSIINENYFYASPFGTIYRNRQNEIADLEYDNIALMDLGFSKDQLTPIDYSEYNLAGTLFNSKIQGYRNFYKGPIKKVKHLWWRKASLYSAWTATTYVTHSNTLNNILTGITDIKYLTSVSNINELPTTGNAGEAIVVGTPSSYVGYAWDPILNEWSTDLYDFIDTQILTERRTQRFERHKAKKELMLAMKPFIWSSNYLNLHPVRIWLYGDNKNFDPGLTKGSDVIYNYNNNLPLGLPPSYIMTASTYNTPSYTADTNVIIY